MLTILKGNVVQYFFGLLLWVCAIESFSIEHNRFIKIDSEKNSLETAFRTYKKNGRTVALLATFHFGDSTYYQAISDMVAGNIVIYELFGGTYENKKELDAAVEKLTPEYQRQFKNIRILENLYELAAYSFNLESESSVDYLAKAKVLIHADIYNKSEVATNEKDLELLIDKIVSGILNVANKASIKQINSLEQVIEAKKHTNLALLINSWIKSSKPLSSKDLDRTIISINCLKQALDDKEKLSEKIVVKYGAKHQPAIEQFLLSNGFSLCDTKWLPVLSW